METEQINQCLLEYERPEFLSLIKSVKALMDTNEQIFYRQAFRWRDADNNPQSNCYEMFSAESIAKSKQLEIVRKYGEHIFIGIPLTETDNLNPNTP